MKDVYWIYILIGVIITLKLVGPVLKRKARNSGTQGWEEKQERNAGSEGLGSRVILATNGAAAESLIAPILESGTRVRRQQDHSWAQTHFNTDDVVYTLTSSPTHSVLAVSRAIECGGALSGMRAWRKFQKEIVTAANRQMIAVTVDSQPLVRAPGVEIDGAQVWLSGRPPQL